MDVITIRQLVDYNYAAHRKVWTCIEALTDEQFVRDYEYSVGSVRNQVVHTMSAERLWLYRLQGESLGMLNYEEFPTRALVRSQWDNIERDIRSYADSLTNTQLGETIAYRGLKSDSFTNMRWEMLVQLVNHGTDHRAQILALLYQLGAPTVAQDWMFYLRDLP
jgi:uncharacterized damage-inducible protein DinB